MMLRVQYQNFNYDYVDTRTLDRLLLGRDLRGFFRPSEKKWVNVYRDPIRGMGGEYYGSDRRQSHKTERLGTPSISNQMVWRKQ
jgi:hypothetical protein